MQRLNNCVRIAGNNLEQYLGRSIRRSAPRFPILERIERETKTFSKSTLAHSEFFANRLNLHTFLLVKVVYNNTGGISFKVSKPFVCTFYDRIKNFIIHHYSPYFLY